MKRFFVGVLIFIGLIVSAIYLINRFLGAGTIGNIEMYKFNVSKEKLEKAVDKVFEKYPQMVKSDTIYNLDGTGYENDFEYCVLMYNNQRYIFGFSYVEDSLDWPKKSTHSTIALVYAATYGDDLELPSNFYSSREKRLATQFKDRFISKVKIEL